MKRFLAVVTLITFSACSSNTLEDSFQKSEETDPCETAIKFPNAQVSEELVAENYSGELNNYWGDDTTKLDFKHIYKNGELVESLFYFENGTVNEKYTYKCESLHGNIEFFHENGQLGKVIPYQYGRREGIGILYDSLGNEVARVQFRNDSIIENSK